MKVLVIGAAGKSGEALVNEALAAGHKVTAFVRGAAQYKKANVNPALMDITFAGSPISCSPSTCELLSRIYPWREVQMIQEAGSYKYVIDVRV